MTEELKDMDCAAFQAQLPELIGTGDKIGDHPHVQSCDLCRAFLEDLEAIAAAAREYFDAVAEPRDEVWLRIQAELEEEKKAKETAAGPEIPETDAATGEVLG